MLSTSQRFVQAAETVIGPVRSLDWRAIQAPSSSGPAGRSRVPTSGRAGSFGERNGRMMVREWLQGTFHYGTLSIYSPRSAGEAGRNRAAACTFLHEMENE